MNNRRMAPFSMKNRKLEIVCAFLILFSFRGARWGFSEAGPGGYALTAPDEVWVNRTLKSLSLKEKIAQLIHIRVQGRFVNRKDPGYQAVLELAAKTGVGGVVLFAGNVYESAILLNELQKASNVPLLVSADFERGASFRIADTTSFPWAMALGATGSETFAYREGRIAAQESRAMGVHWIFAPVVDVNNNPDNPVINIRSFGEDPGLVARLGAAFIRGARDGGVLAAAKHFPGHGDTATDSHLGLAVVKSDRARLETVELLPFKSAISAGVDSIMTAHVAVPRVTGSPETPATLSFRILTDLLRNDLKFKGIVVTDALEMGGVANRYWSGLAAVRAVQAGADALLLPANASAAIAEMERAVKRGDITEARINESVAKILRAKSSLKLPEVRTSPIDEISADVSAPESAKLAQEIADSSITAVKDAWNLLPVDPLKDRQILSLVLSSDIESNPLPIFQTEIRRRYPSVQTIWADARISGELSDEIEKAALKSDLILCSTLVRLSSGQGAISIPKKQRQLIERLMDSKKPVVWVAFGNPYVFLAAPRAHAYICTFSYSDTSQIAAAKAVSGEIPMTGKMPVSIPGHFKPGSGLEIPRIDMTLKKDAQAMTFSETEKIVSSLVDNGEVSGAAILAGRNSSIIWKHCAGISCEAVFDLSTLSGVVGATSAAIMASASKDLILNAPVQDYHPESSTTDDSKFRIQDLLSRYSKSASDSDLAVLSEIVARASGAPLDQFLAARLFNPLEMHSTFSVPPRQAFRPLAPAGAGASARLFSSAEDLAVFAQMLCNGGIYEHRRYFDRSLLAQFMSQGLGWSKSSATNWSDGIFSKIAFGHNASSGSALWIDPEKKLFIVLLVAAQDGEKAAQARKSAVESLVREISAR